jgi:hypothetical protein
MSLDSPSVAGLGASEIYLTRRIFTFVWIFISFFIHDQRNRILKEKKEKEKRKCNQRVR